MTSGSKMIFVRGLVCAMAIAGGTWCAAESGVGASGAEPSEANRSQGEGLVVVKAVDHGALDGFLKKHVRDGGLVDYLAVRRPENMAELQGYLDSVAKVDDEALPADERLALYCNLYNAVMIKAVAQRYRVGWRASENAFGIFKEALVPRAGGMVSLDYLEHTLMRKKHFADEPRIHAAIVCGAIDCPELVAEAYTGAAVRGQLEERMTRWVNCPVRTPVSAEGVVRPSRLFMTYADDFGGKDKVEGYVRRYLAEERRSRSIAFQTYYEWAPNVTKPREGERYVYVTRVAAWLGAEPGGPRTARAGLGAVLRVVGEDAAARSLRVENPNFRGAELYIDASDTRPYPPGKDD